MSNSIIFCPKFWDTKTYTYVNERTKNFRPLSAIDDLRSYEHVLIHEWFHNRDTDVGLYHITDVKGDYGDGPRSIYGSYATQHYAWKHVLKGGKPGDFEFQTIYNADSFAWMVSFNWYRSMFGWADDGALKPSIQFLKRDDNEQVDPYKDLPLDPDAVDESKISDQAGSPDGLPEATTYNRNDCPNCLVTEGGCIAV